VALRFRSFAACSGAPSHRLPQGSGLRRFSKWDYSRDLRPAKWGSGVRLHSSNPEPFMSALGQKRTSRSFQGMSALPPKADINLKMNHATTGCMGDSIRTPDRVELVDQNTYMELGRVDRYAKTASNRFVRHSFG